jgi:hypothetical protein
MVLVHPPSRAAEAGNSERAPVVRSRSIRLRKRYISGLLIGGLVGKRFEQALSFFLSLAPAYLRELGRFA